MGGQKTDERDVQLGRQIAEKRKRARLTQKMVGDQFDMSPVQIQKYEKGTNRISAIHLAILSQLTGTPVSEFFAAIPELNESGREGFAEKPQQTFPSEGAWSGLATVVARHVSEHFGEDSRKEFADAIDTLSRELNRS